MRNFFPTLCLLAVLAAGWGRPARAQTGETVVPVRLSWTAAAALRSADPAAPRRVPTFQGASHGPDDVLGTYTLRLPGTVVAGDLRDAVYEAFPAAEAKLLGSTTLPAAPSVQLRFGTEARHPYSYVLLKPVRRNSQTGQAERLLSFSYAYQATSAPAAPGGGATTNSTASTTATRTHAAASVLRTGDWFKIGVPASGVYKLDQATLRSLGLPVASLDPHKLQLYGNATGLLPQANAALRPDDLAENNILLVNDNNDAVFDANEYFLFYARGPHTWQPSQPGARGTYGQPGLQGLLGEGGRWKHLNNIYADTAYYFVTVGPRNGRRITTAPTPAAAPTSAPITTFLDRRFYEHDLVNVLHSGRRWLGDSFSGGASKDFVFSGDGNQPLASLVAGDTLRLTSAVATTALQSSSFAVSLNGVALGTQTLAGIPNGSFTAVATNDFATFTTLVPASLGAAEPRITLTFASGDPGGTGYLDYLELVVKRQLQLSGAFLEFNSLNYRRGAGSVGTFVVGNTSGAQVWEVTNPRRPLAQALSSTGSFVAYTDSVREFVAVQPTGTFGTPRLFGKIPNQNLHDLNNDGKLDLVIVTYPPFQKQAEQLAQHRRDYNGLNVQVVTTKQVYNEFSSGGQDVTAIRDLMKQVYDRNPDPAARRNYLLLFGDASFDYKSSPYNDASQEPAWWASRAPFRTSAKFDDINQNFVPTYESRESFLPVSGTTRTNIEGENSYSSEDYYGLLDDSEGEWIESVSTLFETVDIGIGRVPVRPPLGGQQYRADASLAQQVVDKIISYDDPASFGKWRNRITLTADDGDYSNYATESEQTFAANISRAEPAYNLRKDYLDLFPQVATAGGQRSPAAVAAIDESLEQGSLLIGYTGHGSPDHLTDEQIITAASLRALQNRNRLTFLVTGTCDLSTYDNPDLNSAGEQALVDNQYGGAVGLFTTTRVVLSFFNTEVVNSFYSQVLARNAAGALPYLGLAASVAKNNAPGGDLNNRNYTLLADPTTRLAYPRQRVVLDSINGRRVPSITASLDTLQALGQVRLSGHIENNGVLNTNFGGTADITIFDKPVTVQTLGNESAPVPVSTQENVIYGGQATVRAGRFSVRFVVPKDIAYNTGLGKISLYAADLTNKVDAQGYQLVAVGGAARGAAADTTPPTVQLFMTDETFVSGGSTDLSPLFIARLTDKSGINTSSAGVGHDITATLDNNPTNLVVVNDSYTSDVDNFMSGRVRYPYKNLAPGPHTISLKAWDTYNNSAVGTVDFIAAQSAQLALDHVLNYPNPFSSVTTFHFDQNHASDDLDVQVQIFTVAGRLVKTLRTTVPASTAHVPSTHQDPSLSWNGRDDYGDQLARGVYVYRVSVRLASGQYAGQTATKFEKLVLLN